MFLKVRIEREASQDNAKSICHQEVVVASSPDPKSRCPQGRKAAYQQEQGSGHGAGMVIDASRDDR